MSRPRILRLSRPYDSVEEYVANEGWSISAKRMILLDQPRLAKDTVVRFEVSLANKEKVIRAEARVVGYQAPENGRPGGPKVRFKRFGGSTKSFIQRIVAEHGPVPGLDTIYPSSPAEAMASALPADSATDLEPPSAPDTASSPGQEPPSAPRASAPRSAAPSSLGAARMVPTVSDDARARLRERMQAKSEHHIAPPPDRDSLLERLRERARAAASP